MKISVDWLNDYIETGLNAEKIADILSDLGFPCEGIEYLDNDTVIDVEITSNRGDCLGYIGVARELAAVTGKELKIPKVELGESEKEASQFVTVEIHEPELCHRYTAGIIEGVKVAASPDWMKNRLESIGLRSVNNVVDATNYVMIETGQPPHAFDYEKINDGKVIVRKAKAGETIVSIDGTKCELTDRMLVIADSHVPIAIAGVMGGLDSEVSDVTTTILLEDAHFDPVTIRTASRGLSLPSESSFRFERTVDAEQIAWASARTAQLIIQVAGGEVAKGLVDIYPQKANPLEVSLRLSRLNKLLGIEVPCEEVIKILTSLKFCPSRDGDTITCSRPSWRSDVCREADLIEEVARVYGYNKIPTEHKIKIEVVGSDPRQKLVQMVSVNLNSCGFYETINVTFLDNLIADLFVDDGGKGHLAVKDVSRKSANILRQSLLPSLLGVLKTNLNAKNTPCRVFEIANTFVPASGQGLPVEETKVGLVCDGDLQDLRGTIEIMVKAIDKVSQISFVAAELPWAQAGAEIVVNGTVIGCAGLVSKAVKDGFDFKDITPVAAELNLAGLAGLRKAPAKAKPIPRFPAIDRDISLVLDEDVTWAQVTGAINKKASDKLQDIKFVGIYRGKGIDAGQKSLTLSLTFRDEDGTLTHDTVDGFQKDIVASLAKSVNAQIRTA